MPYLLFHKPYGVLSQFGDAGATEHATLRDFIPVPEVYPVGRLDQDSEGLMLLTDDGKLQHWLSDPRFRHPRSYWAQVEGVPTAEAIARLTAGGLAIQNYHTLPCGVAVITPQVPPRNPPIRHRLTVPTAWLALTLYEGKNRQVRRMTAAVGLPTLRLIRVAIAHLELGDLACGAWRFLTEPEVCQLKAIANPQVKAQKPRSARAVSARRSTS
ncbi:MAG: pseudouridine synthase [Oscillatoriales cyanobacterium SM2_2_1]|nr:pseudouridine synthase [Oscillatoriales cyanobacterium SM2_2_1]